jgi:hypothetical protein
MASPEHRPGTPERSPLAVGTFSDFLGARERFFEALRRDSELRRLEAAWGLPPAGRNAPGAERAGRDSTDRDA